MFLISVALWLAWCSWLQNVLWRFENGCVATVCSFYTDFNWFCSTRLQLLPSKLKCVLILSTSCISALGTETRYWSKFTLKLCYIFRMLYTGTWVIVIPNKGLYANYQHWFSNYCKLWWVLPKTAILFEYEHYRHYQNKLSNNNISTLSFRLNVRLISKKICFPHVAHFVLESVQGFASDPQ